MPRERGRLIYGLAFSWPSEVEEEWGLKLRRGSFNVHAKIKTVKYERSEVYLHGVATPRAPSSAAPQVFAKTCGKMPPKKNRKPALSLRW